MTIDSTRIDKEELHRLRRDVADRHGIDLHRQCREREAAKLLVPPEERREGSADVSTLKRKRRAGKIPFVPRGAGSVAYLGMMLCDFIAFGERSVLLWGGGDEGGGEGTDDPTSPTDGPAPPGRDGGGRDAMEAAGGSDGPVHQA